MKSLPSISIITCLYNGELSIFKKMLEGIKKQRYPKNRIEHLIMDGGSEKKYIDLARKYGCQVVRRIDLKEKALVRMKLGVLNAKNDIVLFLEPDNIILDSNWLMQMVKPFNEDKKIVGTFSIYNTFEKDMPMVTKYSALIGVNDPLVYYLGKSEKLPRFKNTYDVGKILRDTTDYTAVQFNKSNLPTLGDNGHMVRRKLIVREAKNMKQFYHTDAFYNLLLKKHDTYGVVKNDIVHYTGSDLIRFFSKRTLYKSQFYDNNAQQRSYFVFTPRSKKDIWNLIKFIIFSITFFQTIFFSLKGYLKVRETAWFLHPIACILAVFFYTKSEITRRI